MYITGYSENIGLTPCMFVFYVCINEYIHAGVETASYAELPGVEGVVAAWLTA